MNPDELLRAADIEREKNIKAKTLETWRRAGTGPAWFRLGRTVVYRRSVVDAWIAESERRAS